MNGRSYCFAMLTFGLLASAGFPTAALAQSPEKKAGSPKQVQKNGDMAQTLLEKVGLLRKAGPLERSHTSVKHAFQEIVRPMLPSTVRVFSGGQPVAMGAVVDARGYVATKASELKEPLECVWSDGRKASARLVGVHHEFDLALLKVEGQRCEPVAWREGELPAVGSWLATLGLESEPLAIGVVSVLPRPIVGQGGILGVVLEAAGAAQIREILPNSGASKAGMQIYDVVLAINGREVKDRAGLMYLVRSRQPGETLQVRVRRDSRDFELAVTLGKPPHDARADRRDSMNAMGGPLSERRQGFPSVLQHDTVLRPADCGGPVVDLDGRVVGLNIARGGRVESYAVPAAEVRKLLPDLIAGKFPPTQVASALVADAPPAAAANETQPAGMKE